MSELWKHGRELLQYRAAPEELIRLFDRSALLSEDAEQVGDLIAASEGQLPRQHLVDHHTDGPHVDSCRVRGVIQDDFWCSPRQRRYLLRHWLRWERRLSTQAKVSYFEHSVVGALLRASVHGQGSRRTQKNIAGLDIPVQIPLAVDELRRLY